RHTRFSRDWSSDVCSSDLNFDDDVAMYFGQDGLTSMQGWIIGYLSKHKEQPVFQRDLEKQFNIRRATASGLLQLMERNGLLRREIGRASGREREKIGVVGG